MGKKLDAIDKVKAGAKVKIYEAIPDNEKPRNALELEHIPDNETPNFILKEGDILKFIQHDDHKEEWYVGQRCWFATCDYCKYKLHVRRFRNIFTRNGLDGKAHSKIYEYTDGKLCPNCMATYGTSYA